jgi:hypothetical protein
MNITATVMTIILRGAIYKYFVHNGKYYGFERGEPVDTGAKTLIGFKRWAVEG